MRIYFSGGRGLRSVPETLTPELKPHIMLTFHDIGSNGTIDRFNAYLNRIGFAPSELVPRTGKKAEHPSFDGVYTRSMFMDSGAFSLYNEHVRKKLKGQWPKEPQDYEFYSLEKGSEFRKYCREYARWVTAYGNLKILWTTIDAIRAPERSWEIQQFLEKEYGLDVIPVVHAGTDLKYLERYLEKGYRMIGLGGLGQNISVEVYKRWAGEAFKLICPASNKFMPVSRIHGFAMTSSTLIQKWPWWSVDSATWVKLAAYGWLYVPYWEPREKRWNFSKPPIHFNISAKSFQAKKHYRSWKMRFPLRVESIERWLAELKMDIGSIDFCPKKHVAGILKNHDVPDDFEEDSLSGHFLNRSKVNLHFLKGLERSRPKWPYPLENRTREDFTLWDEIKG